MIAADPGVTDQVLSKISDHMSNPLVFMAVLGVIAYMFVSKRLAQISGPIGAMSRWWNGRQVARVQRQRELFKVQHEKDREHESAELETLREDVRWLRRELGDMKSRERLRDAQARAHTAWDNEWVPRAQQLGLNISDPPPLYLDLAPLHEENPS